MSNEIKGLHIAVDGTLTTVRFTPDVEGIKGQIGGGWFQRVPLNSDMDMWVDEDGIPKELEVNTLATIASNTFRGRDPREHIYGPAVITGGPSEDGDTKSLGDLEEGVIRYVLTRH